MNATEMNSTQLPSRNNQQLHSTIDRSEFLIIVYGFESTVVVISNLLVLIAVATSQNRKPHDLLITNLACTDLVLGITVLPSVMFLEISDTLTSLENKFCLIVKMFDLACISASACTLCVMSIDRHIAISRPLRYRYLMTTRTVLCLISITWILSLALVGPLPFSWNSEDGCFSLNYPFHIILAGLLILYVKMAIVIVLNINIYFIIRKRHCAMAKAINGSNSQNCCSNFTSLQHNQEGIKFTSQSDLKSVDELKSPIKSVNLANSRRRKDDKAAKTLMTIVGVFLVCLSPAMVTYSIVAFCASCHIPRELAYGCLCLVYANSMINPFIYAFSNNDFKAAIKRLLQCKFRC